MAALNVSRDVTRDDARDTRTSVGSQGAAKILRTIGWNAAMADLHLEDTSGTKLPEATTIPPRCLYMCTTRTLMLPNALVTARMAGGCASNVRRRTAVEPLPLMAKSTSDLPGLKFKTRACDAKMSTTMGMARASWSTICSGSLWTDGNTSSSTY